MAGGGGDKKKKIKKNVNAIRFVFYLGIIHCTRNHFSAPSTNMERFVEILRGKSISGSGDTDHLWIDWKRKRGEIINHTIAAITW